VLLQELESCLASCDASRNTLSWLKEALHPGSQLSLFRVTSATFSLAQALALTFAYSITGESSLLVATAVILLLIAVNLVLTCWESYLRSVEIYARARRILSSVREASEKARWGSLAYPHLHTPPADSIVLEWTIRDGEIINLPWALLVRNDIVLLKPGQVSPSKCSLISDSMSLTLEQGDTFHTDHMKHVEKSLLPEFKSSVPPQRFLVETTPFVQELREMLLNAHCRPLAKFHKQRYFLVTSMLEHIALPATAILALVWNLFRHHHDWTWLPETKRVEYFLKEPVTATLPLAPLVLPIWWILTSHASLATILVLFAKSSPSARSNTADPFDDTVETPEMEESIPRVPWPTITQCFLGIVKGRGEYLARTENLLYALGSVTAFCCTDKKGILSWPNTSPEKIYFLKKTDNNSSSKPAGDVSVDEGLGETHRKPRYQQNGVTPEILTVTHDPFSPFRVEFDDPQWKTHLSSLKPIGLSILLNTCNLKTEEKYTEFYNYLLCESTRGSLREGDGTLREGASGLVDLPDLLPIATRGCLCELSSRIGMSNSMVHKFTLEQQLQTFRPVVTDTPGADTLTKNLSVAKLKFPFPHMVSLLAQDNTEGSMQLITQGTADIVLDSCVDAWTGRDLTPLSEELRKKVMEFYHRASLTSYCSAFSYRPACWKLPWSNADHTYLELPPNSDPFISQCTRHSHESVDRISLGDTEGRCNSPDSGVEYKDYQNVFTCLESQCNQSFLGMVQMQYQARVDMVQFIDLLEKACIRFVHFSRENELRSRVFSEKMGLESGWNCHISLRGEQDIRENAKLMYSRRWITKQFSAESPNLKSHLNTSLPTTLDPDTRTVNFPKWGDVTSRPLLTRQEEIDLSTSCLSDGGGSGSVSTSSMLQYEMTNRAQLPCGIEKIRPHLEQMDNVPLLVSLFTDCTPGTTQEMVEIMQDYGEVVVMTGSSANFRNISVFLASDASVAIEPLYPQVCQHVPVYLPPPSGPSPVDLAQQLTSLSSSMSIKRDDEVGLMSLLIGCRHYAWSIQHTLQFWVSVSIFLSVVVMLSLAICLPSPVSPSQMLLLVTAYLPALSAANVMSARDSNMRSISTGKNCKVEMSRVMIRYVVWCYGLRFLPALAAITLANFLCVFHYADIVNSDVKSDEVLFKGVVHSNNVTVTDVEEDSSNEVDVGEINNVNMTFLTIYITLTALTFVSRTAQLWQLKVRRSWQMMLVCALLVVGQLGYLAATGGFASLVVPISAWLVYFGAIPVIVVVNEIVKRQEIKVNVRFQKRARLEFGTKLGINSPF